MEEGRLIEKSVTFNLRLCVMQLKTLQTESNCSLQSEIDGKKNMEKKVEKLQVHVPLHDYHMSYIYMIIM